MRKTLLCLAVVAVFLSGSAAVAQICGQSVREGFMQDVAMGKSWEELEMTYGHCRQDKSFTNTPTGSTYYEKMNSCGYQPKDEMVFCDVEVLRRFGYGPFPIGTHEYVLFCLDCNNDGQYDWQDYQAMGIVHVTDDISGGPLSFYFAAWANTQPATTVCTLDDGQVTNVRAILSWVWMPTGCNFIPIWGNQIDFTARRDL